MNENKWKRMKMNENLNIILGISLTFKKYELICIFIKKKKHSFEKRIKQNFSFQNSIIFV